MKKNLFFLLMAICFGLHAEDNSHFLAVTGTGTTKVKANIADVSLGVQVQAKSAIDVQEGLADKLKPVLVKLRQLKVDKLETSSMNIFPEYNNKTDPPYLTGYRGNIEISFSSDVANAGPVIDAAITAGANQMQGFTLRPSEDVKLQAKISSLQLASENAMVEARAVMAALNLEAGEIQQVAIDQVNMPVPIFRQYKSTPMAFAAAPQTELTEQEQEVSASVTLHIGIKQKENQDHQ